jgi:hypothetical protein
MRVRMLHHFLGWPGFNNVPAGLAALRPQVNNPVRGFQDVEVVLDDQDARAGFQKLAERRQQLVDVWASPPESVVADWPRRR